MRHPPVRIQEHSGATLTAAQLLAMSQLRSSVMQIKPDVDPARDFEKFCVFCQRCRTVCLFYAPNGELVGMTNFLLEVLPDPAGRQHWFINPDYIFMRADYRGHPALPRCLLRVMLRYLLLWRGEPIWFGGLGYPTSLMFVDDICDALQLSSDPAQPDMGRHLIERLIQDCGSNWDARRGCASMPTVPPPMGARWLQQAEQSPFYQRYVAACPDWQNGYALVGIARLHPLSAIARMLGKGLRRVLGRREPVGGHAGRD
jgi:hypothetical protein